MTTSPPPIPGAPHVLVVADSIGEHAELAQRLAEAMRRQRVVVSGPHLVDSEDDAKRAIEAVPGTNCWLCVGVQGATLGWLATHRTMPVLAAIYSSGETRAKTNVLSAGGPVMVAVISRPDMTDREAALFFPEFFSELTTHCKNVVNAPMVRFCFAKANRLAPGKAEVWM